MPLQEDRFVMKRLLHSLLLLCLAACAHLSSVPTGTDRLVDAGRSHPTGTIQQSATTVDLADHHMHMFSPAVSQWLEKELDLPHLPPLGLEEVMAVLQKDGVKKAVILSNAYFFAHSTAKQPADLQMLMAENDRLADAVAKHPNRLVGFFSIDPLAESAFPEIERCAGRRTFAGLKLQLANSEVDLRKPAHVKRLAEVFSRANALHLAIVIHLRTQRADYGREDAQIFINRVLPKAPDVSVQIAHLAGWGGYDQATDGALSAFVDRAAGITRGRDNIYFDVSAVVRAVRGGGGESKTSSDSGSAGQDWWPEKRYVRLVERLRKLGLEHILFGTDWPDWTPRSYATDLEKNLPLTADELHTLLSNRAPYLK
jgi:predicted TIM-barrel fold metal-dependent hydrolase